MLNTSDYKWLLILLVLGTGSASAAVLKLLVVEADCGSLEGAVASLRHAAGHEPEVAQGTAAVMDQRELQLMPHVPPIQVGTEVSMPQSDQVCHRVYSFSVAKHFKLRVYEDRPGDPGDFSMPGFVTPSFNIHDCMLDYILVLDTPYFAKGGDDGRVLDSGHPRQPGPHPISARKTTRPDMAEKSVSLTFEPADEPAPLNELELKFRHYQAKPNAR